MSSSAVMRPGSAGPSSAASSFSSGSGSGDPMLTPSAAAAAPPGPQRMARPSTAPPSPSHAVDDLGHTLARCRLARRVPLSAVVLGLPLIRDVPPGPARRTLLLKKLRLCSYMFDSSAGGMVRLSRLPVRDQELDAKQREAKRLSLLEIVNWWSVFRPVLSSEELAAIFDMLAWNLFRPLPPNSFELHQFGNPRGACSVSGAGYTFSPEEDPQAEDPDWPHIQIAYELLLRLVSFSPAQAQTGQQAASKENPHPEPASTLQKLQTSHKQLYSTFLSRRFLLSLLGNFGSEDIRERDYLKTIIHRIYGSSMSLRPFIRRNIAHVLARAIYEDERLHGIAELLEILGSIINGFAVPIKPAHVSTLLERILLPLHKIGHLQLFHPQLAYAVMQFVEKEPALANRVLDGLLKIWPRKNSKKEVLFLNEVDEILERVPDPSDQYEAARNGHQHQAAGGHVLSLPVLSALVSRIGSSVHSSHFQVSEKAVYLLSSNLRKLVFFAPPPTASSPPGDHRRTLLPIVARSIYRNTRALLRNTLETADETMAVARHTDMASRPPNLANARGHWNSTISDLTADVVKLIQQHDEALWTETLYHVERDAATAERAKRKQQDDAAKTRAANAVAAAAAYPVSRPAWEQQ